MEDVTHGWKYLCLVKKVLDVSVLVNPAAIPRVVFMTWEFVNVTFGGGGNQPIKYDCTFHMENASGKQTKVRTIYKTNR